jgi:uncharacterized membrane protein
MEAAFRRGDYQGGVVGGIEAVTRHLVRHFPVEGGGRNELLDKAVVL